MHHVKDAKLHDDWSDYRIQNLSAYLGREKMLEDQIPFIVANAKIALGIGYF
jgi:hypothetical protein